MNQREPRVYASSEIGQLRRVIVHRPDEGIDRVSPHDAEDLLFDDIVYLPDMQREHDVFTDVLKAFIGQKNVIEVGDLLLEALEHNTTKKQVLLDHIVNFEEMPKRDRTLLEELPDLELRDLLITGYCKSRDTILFDPIPNFLFTRDIAVTVNDHVIITKAAKEARFRENFLTRFIYWAHPLFEAMSDGGKVINLNHIDLFPPSRKGEYVSIEGGDVMMIDEDYLLVGCSERSTAYGIQLLKDVLFEKGIVKNVVQINIPSARSWMHIDTLFTQINHNHTVAYKPLVIGGIGANVQVFRHTGASKTYSSVKKFMLSELNDKMEFILAGGGISPYQEREQWTDGCNLVAIRPGVALTYDRNPHTEKAFKEYGYDVLHARDFLAQFKAGTLDPHQVQNTIITLPSNELSRARGGSHCMTCPIERDNI